MKFLKTFHNFKGFEKTSNASLDKLSKPQRTWAGEDFESLAHKPSMNFSDPGLILIEYIGV